MSSLFGAAGFSRTKRCVLSDAEWFTQITKMRVLVRASAALTYGPPRPHGAGFTALSAEIGAEEVVQMLDA